MRQGATPWLRFACDETVGAQRLQYQCELSANWACIFGASGSGKTVLLRLLAGLVEQRSGGCEVHGREVRTVAAHRRRIALVDQDASVFPHLSVRQNVGFAGPNVDRLARTLNLFGLAQLAEARAQRLSGGEAQRVALARAVFAQPDVLLLDESFSGLDHEVRERLRAVLLQEQQERALAGRPMPIVSVTHDVGEVLMTADEVLRISGGRVVAQGAPAEVLREERTALLRSLGV